MGGLRDSYFTALGLNGDDDQSVKRLEAAFARAHQLRQFEIELYWKRATYFWVFQAAIFAALGFVSNGSAQKWPQLPLGLAAMGFLTALAGWLAANGSKFWQENWEAHIDVLETEFEGDLHKTVWIGGDGVRWSVSGVNGRLSVCFLFFWLALAVAAFVTAVPWARLTLRGRFQEIDTNLVFSTAIAIGTALGTLFLLARPSHLVGTVISEANPPSELRISWPRLLTTRQTPFALLIRSPRPRE